MSWAAKTLIIFFQVIFILSVLELLLRIFNFRPPIITVNDNLVKLSADPILGYEMYPKDNPEINSLGLRNSEIPSKKPNGTTRIIVLGDSVTYGCCYVPLNVTFPKVLEQLLNKKQHAYEVINAGVLGYNTVQEAELFRTKLRSLNPDIIILEVTLNDIYPMEFDYRDLLVTKKPETRTIAYLYYSLGEKFNLFINDLYVFRMSLYLYSLLDTKLMAFASHGKNFDVLGAMNEKLDTSALEASPIIGQGMSMLKQSAGNARVIAIVVPYFVADIFNYPADLSAEHQKIITTARQSGFETIDLLGCFQKDYAIHNQKFNFSPLDECHMNPYGHQVLASCLYSYLNSR